ncbi:CdaR family transcriptional regulator [Oceanobacillus iheyensis]|uniref:CdaR family transcriptional regulator n=1 Tax=Oceanobacillus iheyensis TaxID=182710 RepID=UPI00363D7832
MTILTEQLASQIVQRTMSIIHANINIMDRTGTIIASGNPSRIGQLHDGAVQVIREKRTIEIDTSGATHWQSSQSGINLPITFQNNIIGVIGITGPPDRIRDYSQLIQMGAELTLEQAFLTNEIQQNKQIRQTQITNILLGTEQDQTYIQERAHYAKLDIQTTYAVIIIFTPVLDKKHTEEVEKHIQSWLNHEDEHIRLFTNQHLILKKEIGYSNHAHIKDILVEKHKNSSIPNMTIAVGSYLTGVDGWRQSYQQAQKIIEVTKTLYPSGGVWNYEDLSLEILAYDLLKNKPQSTKELTTTYQRILTESDGIQLHQTLQTYIEENGKVSITSDKLFIHRNTLTYRLDKIHQITGKDPRNINHLLELKMASLLYTLESN